MLLCLCCCRHVPLMELNPLSGRAIFEACVEPVLLYNYENWFLTEPLLAKLESFQAEIATRVLAKKLAFLS